MTPPNKAMRDWQQCLIEIWPNYVYIKQDKPLLPDEIFTFNMENIRWLSRVQPFSDTESEVWFDLEIDSLWHVLRVRMQKRLTKAMLDNLEPRLPKTLHMERHRHHPNTRHAPVTAYPAECTDDGNWSLMEPVELYLTPLYLVVLCNTFVERSMPLDEIRQFRLEQMDSQPDNYLIQFEWQTKTLAFATQDQGFAKMLQAAVN